MTPSAQTAEKAVLPNGQLPRITLTASGAIKDINIPKFHKYCGETLRYGIELLHKHLNDAVIKSELGVIVHKDDRAICIAENCFRLAQQKSESVVWATYQLENGLCFCGPSFFDLAEKSLIGEGINPGRALWICSCTDQDKPKEQTHSIDFQIFWSALNTRGFLLNLGSPVEPGKLVEGGQLHEPPVCNLFDLPEQDQSPLFKSFRFASPISLHSQCSFLLNKETFYRSFESLRTKAAENRFHGMKRVGELYNNRPPWLPAAIDITEGAANTIEEIFEDGTVFDHRSGAICFDTYDWIINVTSGRLGTKWNSIVEYFTEQLEPRWQQDRPNYKRVLAPASKMILRGEDYYANLRNAYPLRRLKDIVDNLNSAVGLVSEDLFAYATQSQWKLSLGVLDQIRNGALQFAWFEHRLPTVSFCKRLHSNELAVAMLRFLNCASYLYYSVLAGKRPNNPSEIKRLWLDVRGHLNQILEQMGNGEVPHVDEHVEIVKLIRRWREADHPGENLLVTLQALEESSKATAAVGIGWGGIELPVVFRQLGSLCGKKLIPVFAAHFSRYSKSGQRQAPLLCPLSEDADPKQLRNARVVIFDDNALSGATIQGVVEYLFVEYAARPESIYLTRVSGERRYDQMRMKGHGVLNPELMGGLIKGWLGETPFSRAWSREVYENPIGVFSLARRRILELLFSNSSADRFDREGF
jgi:hypothetical protein